jgi:hypothetical protein
VNLLNFTLNPMEVFPMTDQELFCLAFDLNGPDLAAFLQTHSTGDGQSRKILSMLRLIETEDDA